MHNDDQKPDSQVAYAAIHDGVSAVISSAAIVGRYWWNVQMKLLQATGAMPLFKPRWWLFLVVGFLLMAIWPPIGIAFVVSFFCAGEMDPIAEEDFIVPLRREDHRKYASEKLGNNKGEQ